MGEIRMFNSEDFIVYAKEAQLIGELGAIDFAKQNVTVIVQDENGKYEEVVELADATFLQKVGVLRGVNIFDRDVVGSVDGKKWEVVLQENKETVQLHLLDEKLNRVEAGDVFGKEELKELDPYVELVDSIFVLKDELEEVDLTGFKIMVVREVVDGDTTYFYAMNKKDTEEVDLIKATIFEDTDEDYTRITLSYNVFVDSLNAKTLVEVEHQEFLNYLIGLKSFEEDEKAEVEQKEADIADIQASLGGIGKPKKVQEEVEVTCEDCDEPISECECPEW
jgi:hypothetical protein